MNKIEKLLGDLNENDLEKVIDLAKAKLDCLKNSSDKNMLVPQIFHDKVTSIKFDTNFAGYDDIESMRSLWCEGVIELKNNIRIRASYETCRSNDWNTGDTDVCVEKQITRKGKHTWEKNKIKYLCKKKYQSNKIEYATKIDKSALKILDDIGLEKNIYHMKMLGVLINNLVAHTQHTCDPDSSHDEIVIDCKEIHKMNSDESLEGDNFLIINNFDDDRLHTISFSFD